MGEDCFDESDDAALAELKKKLDHDLHTAEFFNLGFNFTVLEFGAFNLDDREQRWVSKLNTLKPFRPKGDSESVTNYVQEITGYIKPVNVFF